MIVYVDYTYKCYTTCAQDRAPVETDFFDGKCDAFIEGYRFIPAGKTWTRSDGEVFYGEMITPWKSWEELNNAQREYEREQLEKANIQNAELLETMAAMVDEVYQSDIETLGI